MQQCAAIGDMKIKVLFLGLALCSTAAGRLRAEERLMTPPEACPALATGSGHQNAGSRPRPQILISASTRAKVFVPATDAVDPSTPSVVFDTRLGADHSKVWIPGALRIGPEFVRTNPLVQNTDSVFLIGDGKDEARIYEAVQNIPRKSLKPLKIVSGGLPEWHRAGGAVSGDASLLDAPVLVNEREFHELLRQGATVGMIGKATSEQKQVIGDVVELATDASVEDDIEVLRRRISDSGFVLVLPGATDVDRWTRAWLAAFHRSPFIFVDPGSRYANFLDQQGQIAANAGTPLQHRCDWH